MFVSAEYGIDRRSRKWVRCTDGYKRKCNIIKRVLVESCESVDDAGKLVSS
jgi:hypothetical protein